MHTVRRHRGPAPSTALLILVVMLTVTQCGSDDPSAPSAPAIGLSASVVNFSSAEGGADPQPFVVNVTNAGSGDLTGLVVSPAYGAGQPVGWLEVALDATEAPTTMTFAAITGDLAVGTYTATVTLTSPAAANSPRTIAVNFNVVAAGTTPLIDLPTDSIIFIGSEGEANPLTQTLPVTNGGDGELTGLAVGVSYADGQPTGWLGATLTGTTAPAVLTLKADISGLTAGIYNAIVALTSPVAGNNPQNLGVELTLTTGNAPVIMLSAATVDLSAAAGGVDPLPASVAVANGGGRNLTGLSAQVTYDEGQPKNWLAASLGGTAAPTVLMLQASTGSLAPGSYNAVVAVSSDVATNSPQVVTVKFNVLGGEPQTIVLPTSAISFIGTAGETPPLAQAMAVTNGAAGSLTGLATAVLYTPGQATGWLASSLDGTTAPTTLRITPDTTGLGAGTYNATVTVSSPVAGNSPVELAVTMRLTSGGP